MPLRPVNREQAWLLPPALDELLAQDTAALGLVTRFNREGQQAVGT